MRLERCSGFGGAGFSSRSKPVDRDSIFPAWRTNNALKNEGSGKGCNPLPLDANGAGQRFPMSKWSRLFEVRFWQALQTLRIGARGRSGSLVKKPVFAKRRRFSNFAFSKRRERFLVNRHVRRVCRRWPICEEDCCQTKARSKPFGKIGSFIEVL